MKTICLIGSLICSLMIALFLFPSRAVMADSLPGCVTDWYVSYGGTANYTLLRSDPLGLPLSALRFDQGYNTRGNQGYLDFDHDNKSDVFAAVLRPDGNYQWMYSSSGTSDWINLTYASVPPDDLRFGDFNTDGFTDVFAALPIGGGLLQWVYSSKGTGAFQNLAYADTPLADLRFGDFNANGQTDIFTVQDVGGGYYDWLISYDSTTSYHNVNTANTPLDQMLFVDVNGDAHTDVFTTIPDQAYPDLFDWVYSSHGSMDYETILVNSRSYAEIRPGDFDGDYKSDFFFTTPLNGGLYQWWYQSPVKVGATMLNYASTPPDQLRFGDFNGDGITDVFALVQQCKVNLPALFNGQ